MSEEKGHNYTFHIPYIPWHEQTDEQKNLKGPIADIIKEIDCGSKPYLEEVRQLLLHIMSNRHNPKDVWECASEALRLIDMEAQDGKEN